MGYELLLMQRSGDSFERADENVADVILIDDLLGLLPARSGIQSHDVFAARSLRSITSTPLRFMARPAQHRFQAGKSGDARIVTVSIAHGLNDHAVRRAAQPFDCGSFIRILALD